MEDNWYWGGDRSGEYTVKGSYRFIKNSQIVGEDSGDFNWQSIWKLSVHPKIKKNLSRVFSDCLPTLQALHRRKVDLQNVCPQCLSSEESTFHSLVSFRAAKNVWVMSDFGIYRVKLRICTVSG